jgi:hypothetical protein
MGVEERLKKIRQRVEKASAGPWVSLRGEESKIVGPSGSRFSASVEFGSCYDEEFIAHARQDIPYLLNLLKEKEGPSRE